MLPHCFVSWSFSIKVFLTIWKMAIDISTPSSTPDSFLPWHWPFWKVQGRLSYVLDASWLFSLHSTRLTFWASTSHMQWNVPLLASYHWPLSGHTDDHFWSPHHKEPFPVMISNLWCQVQSLRLSYPSYFCPLTSYPSSQFSPHTLKMALPWSPMAI